MVKVRAEPEKAMMVSKEGTRMAMASMTMMVPMRMLSLRMPRVEPERPRRGEVGICWGERPMRCSIVTTMGRALGRLVVAEDQD